MAKQLALFAKDKVAAPRVDQIVRLVAQFEPDPEIRGYLALAAVMFSMAVRDARLYDPSAIIALRHDPVMQCVAEHLGCESLIRSLVSQ